jgi:hypothetical protein
MNTKSRPFSQKRSVQALLLLAITTSSFVSSFDYQRFSSQVFKAKDFKSGVKSFLKESVIELFD